MGVKGTGSGGLRADAARNRRLIVKAAHEAFAAEGMDVSMAEVARRAGVGFATAQRRFPTRQLLVAAVVREQVAGIGEIRERTEAEDGDAWDAFATPIRSCCTHQAEEPGLAGALAQILSTVSDPVIGAPVAAVFQQLATRAKVAGDLRADVTLDDVLLILKANAGVVANSPGHEVASSQRFVELALRSLRGDSRPDPAQAPSRADDGV